MLRIGISSFQENRDCNGINFAMPKYSDFMRFGWINKEDLSDGWSGDDERYTFFDLWSGDKTIGSKTYKKGMNVFVPMYVGTGGIIMDSGLPHTSDIRGNLAWNNIGGIMGVTGDNGCFIGYKDGNDYRARIILTESVHQGTGDHIKSFGNWNLSGFTIHNGVFSGRFVNSYSSVKTRSVATTTSIEGEYKQARFVYENVEIKNNKAILNIPNRYTGINEGYIINSIVKKGRGDVWISEETENRFTIEAENDIKVNVEVIIKLKDVIIEREEAINIADFKEE